MLGTLAGLLGQALLGLALWRMVRRALSIGALHPGVTWGLGYLLGAALVSAGFWALQHDNALAATLLRGSSAVVGLALLGAGLRAGRFQVSNLPGLKPLIPLNAVQVGLLALIGIHVALVLGENLTRPVFPWDAWTTWIYRAKVWFFAGNSEALIAADQWLQDPSRFTMPAAHYPGFVSRVALYAALNGGDWSDITVNLPWGALLLALLGLFFGTLREAGASRTPALVFTAILASLPLVNIHFALAGYADAWMLASAGLGMAWLLVWNRDKRPAALIVAVLLIGMGLFIKREGAVWAAVGVALLSCSLLHQRRLLWPVLGVGSALVVLAYASGLHAIDLGALGVWGVRDDSLRAGILGSVPLAPTDIAAVYAESLFEQANWHLLPLLTLVALPLSLLVPARERTALWVFTALLWLIHWVIFALSIQSQFAVLGTAHNRLLLHMAPASVMLVYLAVQPLLAKASLAAATPRRDPTGAPGLFSAARNWLAAGLLLVALPTSTMLVVYALDQDGEERTITASGEQLAVLAGEAVRKPSGMQLGRLDGGFGVLSIQSTPLVSREIEYALIKRRGQPANPASVYWTTAQAPGEFAAIPLGNDAGFASELAYLPANPRWADNEILELGYLQQGRAADDSIVASLALLSGPSPQLLLALMEEWLETPDYSQVTINQLFSGPEGLRPSLVLTLNVALGLLVVVLLVVFLLRRRTLPLRDRLPGAGGSIVAATVLAWLIADAAWLHQAGLNLVRQWQNSLTTPFARVYADIDRQAAAIREVLSADAPVLLLAPDDNHFFARRLVYALAPNPAMAIPPSASATATSWTGAVLVFATPTDSVQARVGKLLAGAGAGREMDVVPVSRDLVLLNPREMP